VVRTSCCSNGRGQTLHLFSVETMIPINTKFLMIDYVGEMKKIAQFRLDRFYGASPHVVEIYSSSQFFCCTFSSLSCFVDQPIDHNSKRILTYDGSKDVFGTRMQCYFT